MIADILELDYRGLGVAKINGKAWFVENALPLERVQIRFTAFSDTTNTQMPILRYLWWLSRATYLY